MDEQLKCETCGATHHEKIIFEKPKRICFRSDISELEQNTTNKSGQENICIDCFKKEIDGTGHTTKLTIKSINNNEKTIIINDIAMNISEEDDRIVVRPVTDAEILKNYKFSVNKNISKESLMQKLEDIANNVKGILEHKE